VRDVRQTFEAEPGQTHLDRREAADVLRVGGGEPEDGPPADVLSGDVHRADVEVLDEPVQVVGGGRAVMVLGGGARVAEPAQVDGEHPVRRREQGDDLVERPPALREPVDEQDRRSRGAGGHVVQVDPVERGGVMLHDGSSVRQPGCLIP
jgi:hypothetical protein